LTAQIKFQLQEIERLPSRLLAQVFNNVGEIHV
jgi:hypothetical protein